MVYPRGSIAKVKYTGEEDADNINQCLADVANNEDELEKWEKLVQSVERLDGGLHRNSHPSHLEIFRNVYDRFLSQFPLFFGYWKKYADLEFTIGGTEAAELVYERGVSAINCSVDLWINYCVFKTETSHEPDVMRELFERAAEAVGMDYMSHPFWDRFIEFEDRFENHDNIFKIYERLIHMPLYRHQGYWEKFRQLATTRPVKDLAPADLVAQFQAELRTEYPPGTISDIEFERALRHRLDQYHLEIFHRVSLEVNKRWQFEEKIKRPYFHVTELDEAELVNWRKYLDYEETEGNFHRIVFLYERCLVSCALYDEFWLRFARWMYHQGENKVEDVRIIYNRASCVCVPMSRPTVRLNWARFEESLGTPDSIERAKLIYEGVLAAIGPHIETIVALANLIRRHQGIEQALEYLEKTINEEGGDIYLQGCLVAEQARLLYRAKGDTKGAREFFWAKHTWYLDSRYFCINWLEFEMNAPSIGETDEEVHLRVKKVHDVLRKDSRLSPAVLKDLSHVYMAWLLDRCSTGVAKEFMDLDKEVNGPFSVRTEMKKKLAEDGKESTTDRRLVAENGHPGVAVNDAAIRRGEDPYAQYYAQQGAQPGPAQPLRFT